MAALDKYKSRKSLMAVKGGYFCCTAKIEDCLCFIKTTSRVAEKLGWVPYASEYLGVKETPPDEFISGTAKRMRSVQSTFWPKLIEVSNSRDDCHPFFVITGYETSIDRWFRVRQDFTPEEFYALVSGLIQGLADLDAATNGPHGNIKANNLLLEKVEKAFWLPRFTDPFPDEWLKGASFEQDYHELGMILLKVLAVREHIDDVTAIPDHLARQLVENKRLGKGTDAWIPFINKLLDVDGDFHGKRPADLLALLPEAPRGTGVPPVALAGVAATVILIGAAAFFIFNSGGVNKETDKVDGTTVVEMEKDLEEQWARYVKAYSTWVMDLQRARATDLDAKTVYSELNLEQYRMSLKSPNAILEQNLHLQLAEEQLIHFDGLEKFTPKILNAVEQLEALEKEIADWDVWKSQDTLVKQLEALKLNAIAESVRSGKPTPMEAGGSLFEQLVAAKQREGSLQRLQLALEKLQNASKTGQGLPPVLQAWPEYAKGRLESKASAHTDQADLMASVLREANRLNEEINRLESIWQANLTSWKNAGISNALEAYLRSSIYANENPSEEALSGWQQELASYKPLSASSINELRASQQRWRKEVSDIKQIFTEVRQLGTEVDAPLEAKVNELEAAIEATNRVPAFTINRSEIEADSALIGQSIDALRRNVNDKYLALLDPAQRYESIIASFSQDFRFVEGVQLLLLDYIKAEYPKDTVAETSNRGTFIREKLNELQERIDSYKALLSRLDDELGKLYSPISGLRRSDLQSAVNDVMAARFRGELQAGLSVIAASIVDNQSWEAIEESSFISTLRNNTESDHQSAVSLVNVLETALADFERIGRDATAIAEPVKQQLMALEASPFMPAARSIADVDIIMSSFGELKAIEAMDIQDLFAYAGGTSSGFLRTLAWQKLAEKVTEISFPDVTWQQLDTIHDNLKSVITMDQQETFASASRRVWEYKLRSNATEDNINEAMLRFQNYGMMSTVLPADIKYLRSLWIVHTELAAMPAEEVGADPAKVSEAHTIAVQTLSEDMADASLIEKLKAIDPTGGTTETAEMPLQALGWQPDIASDGRLMGFSYNGVSLEFMKVEAADAAFYLSQNEVSIAVFNALLQSLSSKDAAVVEEIMASLTEFENPGVAVWQILGTEGASLSLDSRTWLGGDPRASDLWQNIASNYNDVASPQEIGFSAPMQYIAPKTARRLATACGLTLPTMDIWEAASRSAVNDANLAEPLADSEFEAVLTVESSYDTYREQLGDLSSTSGDGTLFYHKTNQENALGFTNLYGNVAEIVLDPVTERYFIVGGSIFWPTSKADARLELSLEDTVYPLSDVGFRLAFKEPRVSAWDQLVKLITQAYQNRLATL